jgi:hypothetical protein
MRSPLTAVIFALELTHDIVSCCRCCGGDDRARIYRHPAASIHRKVSRRGFHLSGIRGHRSDHLRARGGALDVVVLPADSSPAGVVSCSARAVPPRAAALPVIDGAQRVVGVIHATVCANGWRPRQADGRRLGVSSSAGR